MARTRWPSDPVNPGLLPRPGRSDRQRRRVPENLGPGRQIVSQDSPSGVSRIGGQAGTQAPDPTPAPSPNHGSRAGSTIHSLPAESELEGGQLHMPRTWLRSTIPGRGVSLSGGPERAVVSGGEVRL